FIVVHKDPSILTDVASLKDFVRENLKTCKVTLSQDPELYDVEMCAEPSYPILGKKAVVIIESEDVHIIYRVAIQTRFEITVEQRLEYLANFCTEELHNIEREFPNDYIKLNVRQNQFYAPQYLKNEIQNTIINLLSNLQTTTFKSIELYYDIADKLYLNIKNIAQQNRCYCELKLKKN
ncbi:unnamed protein product, partial [Rotaria sp. Silwood2]